MLFKVSARAVVYRLYWMAPMRALQDAVMYVLPTALKLVYVKYLFY